MTLPESPDNVVLALALPRVLGATRPIIGAIIGVSLVIYDLVIDGEGATVEVDPPLSGTMRPGDVLQLWLVGEIRLLDSQIIEDENAITTLRIPRGRLFADRLNELYYVILRGSSNIGTSPTLTMLYNKIRPGLKDIQPEVEGHSELALLLPDVIKNGVGADFVSAQVCVSYPYCRAHDVISLKCNGKLMTYQVGADVAPSPPNPGSPTPIMVCFTVTRAYLDSAQIADQTLTFAYTPTDQLGNTPDIDAVWSVSQKVDEDLAGTRLPAPILREKENDPTDEPGIIDLGKLGSNPLQVIMLTADSRFQPGDTINVTYTARIEGQPDVVVRLSGVVEADEFGQKNPCILHVPNDKVIAGSRVTATYQQLRGGALIGSSKAAIALVTGEAPPEFDALTLREAEPDGTTLQPLKAKDTLTAVIPAMNTRPTDLVRVRWTGATGTAPGGSHTTVARPISEIGLNIELLVSVLAFNLGQAVTVTFTITRNNIAITSKPLTLNVQKLPLSELSEALIVEAENNGDGPELNVSNLTSATIRKTKWPLIALGQYVWLRLLGTNADGSSFDVTLWDAPSAYVRQNWLDNGFNEQSLSVSALKNLKDASTLTIQFRAALGKSTAESDATVFQDRVYTIRAFEVVKPTITRAEDSKGVEILQDGITVDTKVKLTGTASKDREVEILNGPTSLGRATADPATGIWTLLMTGLSLGAHSFTAKAVYGAGQTSEPRTLTIREADTLTFTNPPYVSAPAGRVKNIELFLSNEDGRPVSGKVTFVLPPNFEYADGGSGTREFTTDENGLLSVNGVKGYTYPGAYTLTADTGFATATADVTITAQGGVGTIPIGGQPYRIAVSPDGTRAYICNITDNTVLVVDVITLRVIESIYVGSGPIGIDVSPDGTRVYVSVSVSRIVSVIDTAKLKVIGPISVGNGPSALAVSPDGIWIYVCNTSDHTVSIINIVSLVIRPISVGVSPVGIAVSPDGTRVYVCNIGDQTVSVIDTLELEVIRPISVGDSPYGLAVSPDGTRVYVCNANDRTVSVIDTAKQEVIETIPVGGSPRGIAFSPDGTRAYVSTLTINMVSVIDTVDLKVIGTIPVGSGPYGLAVSPDGTRAYVCNTDSDSVSAIAVGQVKKSAET